ncbi:MAG: hypothetical protein AAB390_05090 [Patescibacteria group bacterium]
MGKKSDRVSMKTKRRKEENKKRRAKYKAQADDSTSGNTKPKKANGRVKLPAEPQRATQLLAYNSLTRPALQTSSEACQRKWKCR